MIGMSVRKGEIAFSPPPLPVPTRPSRPPPSLSLPLPDDRFIFFFVTHHGYFGCSSFARRGSESARPDFSPTLTSCGNKPPRCLSQVALKEKKGKENLGRHCGLVVTLCHVPERRGRAPKRSLDGISHRGTDPKSPPPLPPPRPSHHPKIFPVCFYE